MISSGLLFLSHQGFNMDMKRMNRESTTNLHFFVVVDIIGRAIFYEIDARLKIPPPSAAIFLVNVRHVLSLWIKKDINNPRLIIVVLVAILSIITHN
jgi:hypothetical protein